MPEPIKIALVVVVSSLLLIGVVGLPALVMLAARALETVCGIRFYFRPLKAYVLRPDWSTTFSKAYVERFVADYCRLMPEAYALIDVKVTEEAIREHLKTVKCSFKIGYLKSVAHERLQITDVNNDGKKDTDHLTGLTYGESAIEVGVVAERDMLIDGKMRIERTAFTYELHNAIIWKFAGYQVALGEVFVDPNDSRFVPFLNGKKMADMKSKRAVLDAAYGQIDRARA